MGVHLPTLQYQSFPPPQTSRPTNAACAPVFFLEVKRNRTTPFWKHKLLIPPDGVDGGGNTDSLTLAAPETMRALSKKADLDSENGSDESDDNNIVDTEQGLIGGSTFGEQMTKHISMLRDFADGLEYQLQFDDHRMLASLEREGGSFLRFAQNCLSRERRMNSTRGVSPTTWEKTTASAMFYRTRPPPVDRGT